MKYYLVHVQELESQTSTDNPPETLIINQYQLDELKRMAEESDKKMTQE